LNVWKKLFAVTFLVALMSLPQFVSAEKTDWSDKSYNFRKVRTIVIFDIDESRIPDDVGNAIIRKIEGDYNSNANKLKCEVLTENQARRLLNLPNASQNALKNVVADIADLWIECKITKWKSSYHIVPARTVWEKERRTRRYRNSWGEWAEETYYERVPVTYPPHRVDTSDIIADFEVYDARTGNVVFSREDDRSRDDENAQKDMFGRMCNSFFSDFGKKIK